MSTRSSAARAPKIASAAPPPRPRDRILAAAAELFYRHGIHAVGVDQIAEAAGTNKMTLYRHFASKDVLIAECLRVVAERFDRDWEAIAGAHRHDPQEHLRAWLSFTVAFLVDEANRGCALANAAIELADRDHPAWKVIEEAKAAQREKLVALCRQTGYADPEELSDELLLLLEGARVNIQILGTNSPATRLDTLMRAIVEHHAR